MLNLLDLKTSHKKNIIKNHLEAELSNYFELKSEEEVEGAKESALDVLDSEICTEEACIKKMGSMLDVDFIINFEIIATEQEWNIKGKRSGTFEGIPIVINKTCPLCDLEKARPGNFTNSYFFEPKKKYDCWHGLNDCRNKPNCRSLC